MIMAAQLTYAQTLLRALPPPLSRRRTGRYPQQIASVYGSMRRCL